MASSENDSAAPGSLAEKTFGSIGHMGAQNVVNLICVLASAALVIRNLDRAEYGGLALVTGYQVVLNAFDVSIASILLRDLAKIRPRLNDFVNGFLVFDGIKALLLLCLGGGVGTLLWYSYRQPELLVLLQIVVFQTIIEFFGSTPKAYLCANFQQDRLTRIILISSASNVVLSAGTVWFPMASYVACKNLVVSGITTGLAWRYFVREAGFRFRWPGKGARPVILEALMGFSLWSHLIGISSDIVYRADMIFLGRARSPLRVAGNYNIALQLANMTKILPQILQTNASLAISNVIGDTRRVDEVVWLFAKGAVLLSAATLCGYAVLGKVAIRVLAGSDVDEIFLYGWGILGGVAIFNVVRPFYSYIIYAKSVRECLMYISLPSCVFAIVSYWIGVVAAGAKGLAVANLVNGIFMAVVAIAYVACRTNFACPRGLVTETDRRAIRVALEASRRVWLTAKRRWR